MVLYFLSNVSVVECFFIKLYGASVRSYERVYFKNCCDTLDKKWRIGFNMCACVINLYVHMICSHGKNGLVWSISRFSSIFTLYSNVE
jgi:hypothetical protein